ncbi:MAG: hypothetical protein ACRETJ_06440, partial [Steroidobacteraceae bacterium]
MTVLFVEVILHYSCTRPARVRRSQYPLLQLFQDIGVLGTRFIAQEPFMAASIARFTTILVATLATSVALAAQR